MTAQTLAVQNSVEGFNSIANESNWQNLIKDERTNKNIFFPVELRNMSDFIPSELNDNGEQLVISKEDNQVIKVHGNQYSLLTNEVAFDALNGAINLLFEKGILDKTGAHITDSVVERGGKVIRQYIFPKHTVTLDNGEKTYLRIVVLNSYNGSCNFSLQVGGFRVVCLNGMVTGSKFIDLQVRHSGKINDLVDIQSIARKLQTAVTSFNEVGEVWNKMQKRALTDSKAEMLLLPYATVNNELNLEKLMMFNALYQSHKRDLGANYWALYNTLTAWATHYEVAARSQANILNIRLNREKQVAKTMKSKAWIEQ